MSSTPPVRHSSAEIRRAVAGTAFAAASALGSLLLLARGLELWAEDLCFDACPPPTHSSEGGAFVLAGLAVMIAGVIGAPRLARSDHPWLRTIGAIPVAIVVGLFCIVFGHRVAPELASLCLFLMVSAGIAVVVPPRGHAWFGGLAVGCLITAVFPHWIWITLTLALGALVASSAVDADVSVS